MTPTRAKRARSKSEDAEVKKPRAGPSVGDPCPDFELESDLSTPEGSKKLSMKDMVKDNGVVLFFYPRANTPGCTTQACGFQENFPAFEEAGYKIYGMSADKPRSQASWRKKYKLQYNLLCDPSYEVLGKMGVLKVGKKITRSHMVIEKGGLIKSIQIGVSPKNSVTEALKAVNEKNDASAAAEAAGGDEDADKEAGPIADDAAKETSEPPADPPAEAEDKEEEKTGDKPLTDEVDPMDEDVPPATKEAEEADGNGVSAEASNGVAKNAPDATEAPDAKDAPNPSDEANVPEVKTEKKE